MMSDHSFVSSVSQSTAHFNSSHLKQIESSVFAKIINLKSQKIELMSHLSKTIDQKYKVEDQLLQAIQQKKKEDQKLMSKREYEPVVRKYYELKDESDELQRQLQERSISPSGQDNYMIQQIQQLRRESEKLENQIAQKFPLEESIKQLHKKMGILGNLVSKKQLETEGVEDGRNQKSIEARQKITQLQSYIEEEEYNKKMLYQEILEFTEEIDAVRKQNEILRQKMKNYNDSN